MASSVPAWMGLENRFLINIDHHTSGRAFAHVNWIDSNACAVAELVYQLAGAAGIDITPDMATCLYTAVLSDTGSFCYEGTDAHTFELARNLVGHGADPVLIAQEVYFSNPAAKILLLGAALANLQHDGRLAWLWVTQNDMERTHAAEEDCEGIVNYAIGIRGIEVAVFLRELRGHRVRLSLRSKGRVNVATHRRAVWRRRSRKCQRLHPGRPPAGGHGADSPISPRRDGECRLFPSLNDALVPFFRGSFIRRRILLSVDRRI